MILSQLSKIYSLLEGTMALEVNKIIKSKEL